MITKNHALLTTEVAAHIAADAIIQGEYWVTEGNDVGGKGCFIGCLAHSSDAGELGDKFGLPLPLVKIAENIFENLPEDEAKNFFARLPKAVGRDGKDLSRVHWKFLALELRALPVMPSQIQDVIDPVIAGIGLLAAGDEWPKDAAYAAARAAADAAYAADAAAYAARAAARAAAYAAARAAAYAADAARARQAATFLRLISEAK